MYVRMYLKCVCMYVCCLCSSSYGPQWKTLGLQDRGMWDSDNVQRWVSYIHTTYIPYTYVRTYMHTVQHTVLHTYVHIQYIHLCRFPKTIDLISKLQVPSCEVFFARQGMYVCMYVCMYVILMCCMYDIYVRYILYVRSRGRIPLVQALLLLYIFEVV